jgi:hypothetical protein
MATISADRPRVKAAVLAGTPGAAAGAVVGGDDRPLGGRPLPDGLRVRAEPMVL